MKETVDMLRRLLIVHNGVLFLCAMLFDNEEDFRKAVESTIENLTTDWTGEGTIWNDKNRDNKRNKGNS